MYTVPIKRLLAGLAITLALLVALINSAAVKAEEDNDSNYYYQAKSGDSLTSIAKSFGMTLEKLLLANPQIKNPNILLRGQVITIPAGRSENALLPNPPKGRLIHWQLERDGRRIEKDEGYYLARSGDTLTGIARKYGVSLQKLLLKNPQIEDENKLYRGELVKIPEGRSETAPPFYQTPPDTSSR